MLSSTVNARVRKGRISDAEVLAQVFSDAWRQTYRGIIPGTHLELMIDHRDTAWWRRAVHARHGLATLEVNDTVVGYATFGASRMRGCKRGELFELYILPSHQGLGFGEYLFESCRHRLDKRNYRGLVTWALTANQRATDFYWRRGGRPFAEVRDSVGGQRLQKIGFSWT
ncbi:MAG: GNAT family N-acetyltransferase [Alphaproteobacteria bacterium]|nr:GNAT family N-acetyltransferase [Alphaproteobacteria bacterium]